MTAQAQSRRGWLAGASAALLAGAAIATAARGAPTAADPSAGSDAKLIGWCAALIAMEADWREAVEAAVEADGNCDVDRPAAYYSTLRAIEATPAKTMEGNRAKLAAVVSFYDPDPPNDSGLSEILWDAVCALALPPTVTPVAAVDADGELIELCDHLVRFEARHEAIYLTIKDDDEADRQAALLNPKREQIKARLYELGAPTTPAGQLAFARAALAAAPRDIDHLIMLDGGGISSYLAFGLVHSLAGPAATAWRPSA